MRFFKTDHLAQLQQATFGEMAVGEFFITRTSTPRAGAIYMKMRKTGPDSSELLESTYQRGFTAGAVYSGIDSADRYFRCTEDAFREKAHKPLAEMVVCPGVVNDGLFGHGMRDSCSSCAPFWEQYPVCPTHHRKLTQAGYCHDCRKTYMRPAKLDLSAYKAV